MSSDKLIKHEEIRSKIYSIRGVQVMLDNDLAELYGVGVKRLNEQVRRNKERFPETFCFKLSESEFEDLRIKRSDVNDSFSLRSQIATLKNGRGKHQKYS